MGKRRRDENRNVFRFSNAERESHWTSAWLRSLVVIGLLECGGFAGHPLHLI